MILKRFRQAVLAAACSGRLTEDWRTEHPAIESGHTLAERIQQSHVAQGLGHGGQAAAPTEDVHNVTQDAIPDTWAIEELKVLCQPGRSITYGILKPGPDVSGGVPYVRVADFPNNRLKLGGIRRTTKQIAVFVHITAEWGVEATEHHRVKCYSSPRPAPLHWPALALQWT
jgi:type I restriction enzyme S subunit